MEKFLTLKEMAEVLNVNPGTLRREAIAGRIPFVKVGRVFRFRVEQVLSTLAASVHVDSRGGGAALGNEVHLSDERAASAEQETPLPAGDPVSTDS
jgi:excisionase family DNA binding protein